MHGCLTVPEDGQGLIGEMDHGVEAGFPQLEYRLSTHHGGCALHGEATITRLICIDSQLFFFFVFVFNMSLCECLQDRQSCP